MTTAPEPTGALCGAYLNHPSVEGYCPACGAAALFLGDGGYVTCARVDCPQSDAASTLLEQDPLRTPLPGQASTEAPATNPCRAAGLHRFATHDIEVCNRDRARAAAERAEHEAHRLAMSDALGLGTSAPWGYITERARKLAADPLRRMLDSPVAGVADLAAAAREQADAAHEEHRRDLGNALGLADAGTWPDMIGQVRVTRQLAADAVGLPAGSLWGAIVDRAAAFRAAAMERADLLTEARDALEAAGHAGAHEAHTTPDQRVFWPDPRSAAGASATAEQVVTAADPCPGCETCDLATQLSSERAAHDAHRTALAKALALATGAPWDAITDRARQVTADLTAARAGDAPWIKAYREDLNAANERADRAEATIVRVRDLADRWEHALAADLPYARALRRTLDGEQPAEPEPSPREACCECGSPDVTYHNYEDDPFCGPCAEGRQGNPEPVTVPLLDAFVMETFAAYRRLRAHLNRKP